MEFNNLYLIVKKYGFKARITTISVESIEYIRSNPIPEKYFSDRLKIEQNDEEIETPPEKITSDLDRLYEIFNESLENFGSLFVKFEEKSGKDMSNWIANLQYTSFDELLLCIKYSDLLSDYLDDMIVDTSTINIVFKKWYPLNPSMELRCFIFNGKLKGICQRNISVCYDFYPDLISMKIISRISKIVDLLNQDIEQLNCKLKRLS